MNWHIITGEYPPKPGGVSDYTEIVATAMAKAGRPPRVWTSIDASRANDADFEAGVIEEFGVIVHRLVGRWSPRDLDRMEAAIERTPAPRRFLIQYTPNSWGYKGMNVGFCRFIARRSARGDEIWTVIHEPYYFFKLWDKPARWLIAAANRLMLRTLLGASTRIYITIPYWESRIRPWAPRGVPIECLPIVSNIPVVNDRVAVEAVRARYAGDGRTIIGCFSTFGNNVERIQAAVLRELVVDRSDRVFLLIGRGSKEFADRLISDKSSLAAKIIATGGLTRNELSIHIQACDMLAQAFPYGISGRNSTIVSALAHGAAITANSGPISEPFWSETDAAQIVPGNDIERFAAAVDAILADPARLSAMRTAARRLYDERFSVDRLVSRLTIDGLEFMIGKQFAMKSHELREQ
jgi:glycosyltransferase involved in cell wall biosynthesis